MKSAVRNLIVVTVIVLICCGIAWLYVKSKASSQQLRKPLPTSFFNSSDKFLVFVPVSRLSNADLKSLNPKVGFWIDSQVTKDEKVVVVSERELPNPNYNPDSPDRSPETKLKNLSVRYLNWSDVQKLKPEARLLDDLINADSSRRLIINAVEYSPGTDTVVS